MKNIDDLAVKYHDQFLDQHKDEPIDYAVLWLYVNAKILSDVVRAVNLLIEEIRSAPTMPGEWPKADL